MDINSIEDNAKNNAPLSDNLKNYIDSLLNQPNEEIKNKNKIVEQNNKENILKEFIDNNNIIKNEEKLKFFIEELIKQLNDGNNILIPFLDICPKLIKSYINSKLDEEEELTVKSYTDSNSGEEKELNYLKIFKLLKINSFISREYLFPIYEYFSDIFYEMNTIEETDIRLKKFNKVFELWKIFYDFNINQKQLKEFNSSSFCFMGGG